MQGKPLPPILMVGCGNMGYALLAGWLKSGTAEVVVVKPSGAPDGRIGPGVTFCPDISSVPKGFSPSVIVFAIKPQQAASVVPDYARFAATGAVILSIMAGKTTADIEAHIGGEARVVRAMPNTPAIVGLGFTGAFAGSYVLPEQRELCDTLLSAVGEVAWVEDEGLIDPVTAVSGSGPAYVFLLVELLETAAIKQGVPPDLACRMARRTVEGSGALLGRTAIDAAQLRRNVTSPRGTTERALEILMAEDAWPKLVSKAISAATARSRELSGRQSE